jgi:hypothetical protein
MERLKTRLSRQWERELVDVHMPIRSYIQFGEVF